ncbi:MAG: GNAT family N-acetyltransferase [Pseudomonadota bacterium]|nr:GNAT family N-acetyltransferase [Pseudomonadota bacterium]
MLPERALAYPVTLRPFGLRDAPRVQILAGGREVAEMTALIPYPYPDGAAEAWIVAQAREQMTGREYTFAVTSSDDGTLVGAIGLRPVATERENLGFWIGRPYWGRGYATAAVRAVIALAFGLLDIDVLTAAYLARNPASGRVMEKCGMSLLGTERRNHRGVEEEFCVREITRDDWERLLAMNAA